MANDNQVTLEINVDAKDALAAIELFGKDAAKIVGKAESKIGELSNSFGDVKTAASGLNSSVVGAFAPIGAAIGAAVGAFQLFSSSIDEAVQAAQQLRQIEASLKATGEGGSIATESIVRFSEEIQNLTSLDDDLVQKLFITAKSFGVSAEEAKKLTAAAIDLAAATGVDVDTAIRQLGGTVDGSIGKIGNLGKEFRNLSTEQLKSGAAIDLVTSKFGGSAAKDSDTYTGSVNRLSSAFGDLQKSIGKVVTESSVIQGAINATASVFNALAGGNDIQRTAIANAKESDKLIAQIELVGTQSKVASKGVFDLVKSLETNKNALASNVDLGKTFGEQLTSLSNEVKKSTGLTGKEAEEARKKFDELLKSIVNAGESEIAIAARIRDERLKILNQSVKNGSASEKESVAARKKILEDFENTRIKITDETVRRSIDDNKKIADAERQRIDDLKKATEEARVYIEKITQNPFAFTLDSTQFTGSATEWGAIAAGALNAALNGKKGLVDAIGSGLRAYFPAFGGVFASIFEKLAGGKEQAKAFVKEFISSIPEIISNVVEALPAVLDAVIEVLGRPSFWVDVGKAMAKGMIGLLAGFIYQNLYQALFNAHAAAFERLGPIIQQSFANAYNGISNAILNAFTEIGAFFTGLFDSLKSAFQPLIDAITKAADSISGAFGGKGGQGVISEAASNPYVQTVATGGLNQIPGVSGAFGLTSDQGQGGGGGQDTAILLSILSALQQPMTVQAEAKVNQSAFADIMLQLSRQNARLTA